MLRISRKLLAVAIHTALILISGFLMPQPAAADFIQQGTKLIGTGTSALAEQGSAVAVSADGNTAIVGGPLDASGIGAAWIFVRSNGAWTQQGGKLIGANAVGAARQGAGVALSADGNTAIVGGPQDNSGAGAVWVFTRSSGVWSPQGGKLVGNAYVGAAHVGVSVALSADGNTAIAGANGDNSGAGGAFVFTRNAGTWTQQGSKLVGNGAGGSSASLGSSVALSGDGNTAIAGAPGDQYIGHTLGAAWIFTRTSGTWSQFGSKLVGTGGSNDANQGYSVALSADGKTAAIGGPFDTSLVGAAWVFAFSGSAWTQQGDKLVGTGYAGESSQGSAVSLSGDGNTLFIGGAPDTSETGAAWVFDRSNGAWAQLGNKLVGSSASSPAYQGFSVALSADGSTAVVGGTNDSSGVGASWIWLRRMAHDFNGNGKSDILWRNTSGETGIWFMNGASITSTPSFGVIPNNWSIVGQRDFNGDGKSDLLWLNSAGDIGIWFMNGASVLSSPTLANVGTSWSVVGTGDFDGDGKADILWRSTSGDIGIWFMNGASYTAVGLGNVPTNWSVIGAQDFNGDGKADILWRNTSNDIGIWFMNGATVISAPLLGNVGSTWLVTGTGDFNADGKADILWRNTSNDIGIWFMNGASYTPAGVGNVGASWQVASVGDYDGDGKADILWRSSSNDIGIWFMNGAGVTSAPILGNVGPSWLVQNAASN